MKFDVNANKWNKVYDFNEGTERAAPPPLLAGSVATAAHPGGGRCCVGGWAGDQATRAFHNLTGRRCLPRRLAWWKVRTAPRMPRTRIRCRSQMARSGRRYGYIIVSKHPLPHHHTSRQQGQVERSPGRAMSYATWKVQRHRQKQQESDEETARLWLERLLQQDLGTRAPWLAARARARQLRVRGGWDAWLLMRSHRPLGVCLFCASGCGVAGVDLLQYLKDGTVLCRCINLLHPGLIKAVFKSSTSG